MAAIATRLEMDSERMKFALDERKEGDRRTLAELYRHAKVLSHVTKDHRTKVEAEVPRRLMPRFRHVRAR